MLIVYRSFANAAEAGFEQGHKLAIVPTGGSLASRTPQLHHIGRVTPETFEQGVRISRIYNDLESRLAGLPLAQQALLKTDVRIVQHHARRQREPR